MPRRRKDCPICGKKNLVLSNHLADIHQLSGEERKYYLSGASNPEKREDMSSRKRMRSDDISTVARDDESDEGISSPKRMRNPTMKHQQYPTKIFSVHQATAKASKRVTTLMKANVPKT